MRTLEKEQNVTYANTFDSHSVPTKAMPKSSSKVTQLINRMLFKSVSKSRYALALKTRVGIKKNS